jgi:indolepyruvate ferredoxin oxidoreductase alpha subunit
MHKVLLDKTGEKVLLLGNEAIVRGALESGVQFASTYPGTPASEIGDTFSKIAKDSEVYFEYSTNEKVAFEAAAGAAFSGIRSMVSFKQFGLNVAFDSISPVAYVGVEGGMVVAVADDPSGWSSAQSEQDSRYLMRTAHMPVLEPSNAQECIDFVKIAFDLSERFKIPVFIRLTTRISHTRGIVTLDKIVKGNKKAKFVKNFDKYYNLPPKIIKMHENISKKIESIRTEVSETSELNHIVNTDALGKSKLGVITSGVSFNYVMDAMRGLGIELPVLKLGLTHPLPEKKTKDFIKGLESVMVVEELEPVLEKEVRALAKEANPKLEILGKGKTKEDGVKKYFPVAGEYTPELVISALSKALKKKLEFDYDAHMKKFNKLKITRRFPVLCPGCPHRATFYALKKAAGSDAVFGGDIGCYLLGVFPPFNMQDFVLSMGASVGITHGIKKAELLTGTKQKVITVVGDSTFFHAGIPALINMVYNKSNALVVVLDNRITAMTGHQPNPGMGVTGMSEPAEQIKIEDIARACGVKNVKVVDPYNLKEMEKTVKEFLENGSVSVIVAKHRCYLLEYRDKRKTGITTFEIVGELTDEEKKLLKEYACTAFYEDDKGNIQIDETMCWGCASCSQLIEAGKIKPRKKEAEKK